MKSNIDFSRNVLESKRSVRSLSEFVDIISEIDTRFNNGTLWFRGLSKGLYTLIPSIYRDNIFSREGTYSSRIEKESFKQFKRKVNLELSSALEYYQLMQHYKYPTRLLDWTESSLIALFFALYDIEKCKNPVVWVLEPGMLNYHVVDGYFVFLAYGDNSDPFLRNYTYHIESSSVSSPSQANLPICILPKHFDNRMLSQKSCFTIFGDEKKPLELIVEENNFNNCLAKISISQSKLERIKRELTLSGTTYYSLFPELEGITNDLKYKYNISSIT